MIGSNLFDVENERFEHAVRDAGQFSFGIVAVEAWIIDEDSGELVRPKGGWWRNPFFVDSNALHRLEDISHPLHVSADPLSPGVDIAGELWLDSKVHMLGGKASSTSLRSFTSTRSNRTIDQATGKSNEIKKTRFQNLKSSINPTASAKPYKDKKLMWRDLQTLLEDPDTPKTPRMALLEEAGFGQVSGVSFDVRGHRGIVLYFARSTVSHKHLKSPENEAYLHAAAKLIGEQRSITEISKASLLHKNQICTAACRKFKNNLIQSRKNGSNVPETLSSKLAAAKSDPQSSWLGLQKTVRYKVTKWANKCLGGNSQIPPSLSFEQSLWTFIGAFLGLLMLSAMNEYALKFSDGKYHLLSGPFGALMTLQYGLVAAPASQPRNEVLGQVIAGAISLVFTYIPDSVLVPWVRVSVGPAVAIAVMVKLGITHPPAGAHAVIYASGKYDWTFYFLVVFGSIIAIAPATIINNMSDKRQYPIYWGYCPSVTKKFLSTTMMKKKKDEDKVDANPSKLRDEKV